VIICMGVMGMVDFTGCSVVHPLLWEWKNGMVEIERISQLFVLVFDSINVQQVSLNLALFTLLLCTVVILWPQTWGMVWVGVTCMGYRLGYRTSQVWVMIALPAIFKRSPRT
jgi:hypothetical protein